ncbi:MAG: diacylglycerol/polyprenol kinase family protein [Candidatus Bilamarchaeum sp.]|jgi:dolichol kinase
MEKELQRQFFHIIIGMLSIAVLVYLGRGFLIAGLFFAIIIGTLIINVKIKGVNVPIVDWFEKSFEREEVHFPGWGSFWYAVGVLIAATYLNDISQIAAVIYILAIGDAASTIVGRRGRIKLPFNKAKTVEGSLGFFFSSLPAYFFIGPLALGLAVASTLAESIPIVDDNISVPVVAVIFLMVV